MAGLLLPVLVLTASALALHRLNRHFGRLPATIGVTVGALLMSLALMGAGRLAPAVRHLAAGLVMQADFRTVLLDGLLPFLLFAGALEVDARALVGEAAIVFILATAGVVVSTAVVGGLIFVAAPWVGVPLDAWSALLFGAVIAPTDPIAVIGMLRTARAPKRLEVTMAGESLFNDAVGVVVFFAVAEAAAGRTAGAAAIAGQLAGQVLGGTALGLGAGWLVRAIARRLDRPAMVVPLTLALVAGIEPLAVRIGTSGYLAVIVAGLVLAPSSGQSGETSDGGPTLPPRSEHALHAVWSVIDELLNLLLFTLVGFEALVLPFTARALAAGLLAIPIALAGRLLVVGGTLGPLARRRDQPPRAIAILTWGGLRGGLAIALALAVDRALPAAPTLVAMTYVVVIFSIVVQGLTFRRLLPPPA